MNIIQEEINEFRLWPLWLLIDIIEFFERLGNKIRDMIIEITFRIIGLGIEIVLICNKIANIFRKHEKRN